MAERLATWWPSARRDLPWRKTRDPWAVLLAEAMLQQTQVARVEPRFEAMLRRFPDPAAAARAPVAEMIDAWAGLGYNRRAVALHRTAVTVVERHGGSLPDDLPSLLALPGIGPYTARAILAFAFERDVGVLDTNAARVLARAVAGRPLRPAEAQLLADALVAPGTGWAHNQAMLDVGAAHCRPVPHCDGCPLQPLCRWSLAPDGADPAARTAGVPSRQSRFEGSERQGRGRLVAAARRAPLADGDLASAAGWPHDPDRAARVAAGLVRDGLLEVGPTGRLQLPGRG